MSVVTCIASHMKKIEVIVCVVVGSLSRHEDVLDRCERRVFVEPFALCSILGS
jgi:hypothetical protein